MKLRISVQEYLKKGPRIEKKMICQSHIYFDTISKLKFTGSFCLLNLYFQFNVWSIICN